MKESRTKNSLLNFASSIGAQMLMMLMQFVVRTVFIKTLGENYLGLSGLFSNILNLLSLAELGVGNAIIYRLYEPVARDDRRRITILIHFYRKVYLLIGLVIAVIGAALIPALPLLIKNYERLQELHINAVLVYGIFLFQSVSTYWFLAYKQIIIGVKQKQYYATVIGYGFTIGSSILQILLLLLYPNFILYVFIAVFSGILQNLIIARFADKKYPYINDDVPEKLGSDEVRSVFKDCGALMIYKINNVVVKSTDNIVISSFLGLGQVALYSNYYIFYTTITSLYKKVVVAVGHSLGDLHATHDLDHEYEVFRIMMFVSAILGGTSFVGISTVADEFVLKWLGEKWVLAQPVSILIGLELYTAVFKVFLSKYRTTMGLFQQAKFRPVAGMLINLVISVLLVKPLGVTGVLIGTVAADWLTFMWYDPLIIHRKGFENRFPVFRYYGRFLLNFAVSSAVCALDMLICRHFFVGHGWFSVIVHAIICSVTTPIALLLISLNTPESAYCFQMAKKLAHTIRHKVFRKS